MKQISLATGGFDPIHPGHIAYLRDAKKLSGYLIVGLNSDMWLTRKKGRPFMSEEMRKTVLESIKYVDEVIYFDDSDGSARDAILRVREMYPGKRICFCNGGDRNKDNIPEMDIEDNKVKFVFGCGGDYKTASSSELMHIVKKPWGHYEVLLEGPGWKVKHIVVKEGHRTSLQYHQYRGERMVFLQTGDSWYTPPMSHHRLLPGEYVEVQLGTCDEDDIVRIEDDYRRERR